MMIHKSRRQKLLNQIEDNGLIILSTNPENIRNGDVLYPFLPDSNFWYLTGFKEPECIAVISKDNYSIFLRERDPEREIWDGERLGLSRANEALMSDNAYPISELNQKLPQLISKSEHIYFDIDNTYRGSEIIEMIPKSKLNSIKNLINEMRLHKDELEISLMRHAASISVKAHELAMQKVRSGMFEYEITSLFDQIFRANNAEHAYPPIVAGGKNSCILHYINNDQELHENDLLLIDSGCEYEGYASDITRTFPVSGKFSNAQKEIYSIVLDAQKVAIDEMYVGNNIRAPHFEASRVIKEGLISIGLMKPNDDIRKFYMHGTGHWLGMDVHDVGDYNIEDSPRRFEEGMVMTVEPGIYIRGDAKIDTKFHNIGIRIEDDVLITKNGPEVLTGSLVKEIDDIESIMTK
jgi:Xaa-Pro aminopeptidase